jgi:hypothetical protein
MTAYYAAFTAVWGACVMNIAASLSILARLIAFKPAIARSAWLKYLWMMPTID